MSVFLWKGGETMNKIIAGIMGIVAVLSVVSVSAYALFSAQATVSGITLNTGTAGLKVGPGTGTPTQSSVNLSVSDTLVPGETPVAQPFTLLNDSNEVDFNLTARLTSAGGDWGVLSNLIEAGVYAENQAAEDATWKTLADWNAADVTLPAGPLNNGTERTYYVMYRLSSAATESVAGKSLTNITFVFTGTQTP